MPELGKILVIRGGAIGDFILTLPVLAALREQFPSVRLELLGYPRVTPLALAGGLVHEARSIEARPLASFFAKGGPLPTELSNYFAGFGVIVSYLFDPDRIFEENVRQVSKAQFIVGPHRPSETGPLHATEAFLQPLQRLAIFDPSSTPSLRLPMPPGAATPLALAPEPPAAGQPAALSETDDWLALHPGSGSERKNWPEEKWAALLRWLVAETNYQFLLLGGEAELERVRRLGPLVPDNRLRLAQSLPLPELAWLLQQCRAFLGHDSGISHLAAAVGLKGLILWGDTQAQVWRPRSERMRIVSAPDGLAALPVDSVVAAIREHLP